MKSYKIVILLVLVSSLVFATDIYQDTPIEDSYYDEADSRDGTQTTLIADNLNDVDGESPCIKFSNNIPAGSILTNMTLYLSSQDGSNEALQIIYSSNQTWREETLDTGTVAQFYDRMNLTSENVIGVYYGTDTGGEDLYWQINGTLMERIIDKGPDNLTFCFNNTGDVSDQYAFVSKEGFPSNDFPQLYSSYRLTGTPGTLYINKSSPSCDNDYTRVQVQNKSTPWCNLNQIYTDCIGGDTILISEGTYYGIKEITGMYIDANLTIKAVPGDKVSFKMVHDGYNSTGNGLWIDEGAGLWSSNSTVTSGTNYPRVYMSDMSAMFFTWNDKANFLSSTYHLNAWYNTTTDIQYLLFDDATDPNNLALDIVTESYGVYVHDNTVLGSARIIFQDLTFLPSLNGLDVRYQSNVVVDRCNVTGPNAGLRFRGYSGDYANITVSNSYLNGLLDHSWYEQDLKNEGTMETTGVYTELFNGPVHVINNTFDNWHGAITLDTDSQYQNDGSIVEYNRFKHGRGSQMEIEKYCYNSVWRYNTVAWGTRFSGFSFASAYAINCSAHHNIVYVMNTTGYSSTTDYDAYAVKIQNQTADGRWLNMKNWDIHHNTFVSLGRAVNTMSNEEVNDMDNINWTFNILQSVESDSYTIRGSGMPDDGVYWNNNSYWNEDGYFSSRWCNETVGGGIFTTLAAALASDLWDGTWDTHSLWGEVEFVDPANGNFTPVEGSAVCGDDWYIGALPCAAAVVTPPVTPTTVYPSSCKGVKYTYFGFVAGLFILLPLVIAAVALGMFKGIGSGTSNINLIMILVTAVGMAALFASIMAMVIANIC